MEREPIDVLLIEDDEDDVFIVRRLLEKAHTIDCDLTWKSSYDQGLEAALAGVYDVAVVDYRLGQQSGLQLLERAQAQNCTTPLILMTGQGSPEIDLQAMQAGAADYLKKSQLNTELLERTIRYARERARSQQEIRRQAALLDAAQDAICAYDLDGTLTYWSEGAHRMTGYTREDVRGMGGNGCLHGMVDDQVLENAWDTVLREGQWRGELEQQTQSGDPIIVKSRWTLVRDPDGEAQAVLVINTDITERKRLERQALRSQRMESIGRLVGGIAHDLGNLLVPIQLGVSVLRDRYADNERTQHTLSMIEKSADRGADMVERVLAFARGVEGELRPINLHDIAEEVEQLVEESFPSTIAFEATLPSDLPLVRGDATQLQQVLVNLSVNARDAMPEGGSLTFEAQETHLTDEEARLIPDGTSGHYVHVRVRDTGTGIPQEALGKIFEPFFSTKDTDDGTGLGLSTVYSIVKGHDGFIDVQSELGQGTCFDLYLPVTEAAAPEAPSPPEEEPPAGQGHGECVLVVDDETFVRESTQTVLRRSGYCPVAAETTQKALQLFEEHTVEAVISDVALSDGDGLDVVRAFKARSPGVPIIVCSHRTDSQVDKAYAAGADRFLAKPFDTEALCQTLDVVLAEQRKAT